MAAMKSVLLCVLISLHTAYHVHGEHKRILLKDEDYIHTLEGKLQSMAAQIEALTANQQNLTQTIQDLEQFKESMKSYKNIPVVFAVHSTHLFTTSVAHDILKFDVVEINIGNGFHDNVFICPVGGLYYLSWSYFTNERHTSDSVLFVNGTRRRYTVNNAYGANLYPSAANAIIIQLNKGDRVWLASIGAGFEYREWATFQGWIIQAM